MQKIESVYENKISSLCGNSEIDQLIHWLKENSFMTGVTPSVGYNFFVIQIYLYRTAIFRLTYYNDTNIICIDKPIKPEKDTLKYSSFESQIGKWESKIRKNLKHKFVCDLKNVQQLIYNLEIFKSNFSNFIEKFASTIKVSEISLTNYRNFSNAKVTFKNGVNIIIGENGSGKTALLDSVAGSIGSFLSGFDELRVSESNPIRTRDIRWDGNNFQVPCVLESNISFNSIGQNVVRQLNGPKLDMTRSGSKEIYIYAKMVQDRIRENNASSILPVFAYFEPSVCQGTQSGRMSEGKNRNKVTRFSGYRGCLSSDFQHKEFSNWYLQQKENQFHGTIEDGLNEILKSAEEAIVLAFKLLGESGTKGISIKDKELVLISDNGQMRFSYLSDGHKKIINILGEIICRAAILNPHLGKELVKAIPGVVLIEEIDFHLHPKWQRNIIGVFTKIFPNIQFMFTTHSPNIINTVHKGSIITVNDNAITISDKHSYGRDVNSIQEELMGVPEHNEVIQNLLKCFYDKLDENSYREAEEFLVKLEELLGPDDVTAIKARTMYLFEVE